MPTSQHTYARTSFFLLYEREKKGGARPVIKKPLLHKLARTYVYAREREREKYKLPIDFPE